MIFRFEMKMVNTKWHFFEILSTLSIVYINPFSLFKVLPFDFHHFLSIRTLKVSIWIFKLKL